MTIFQLLLHSRHPHPHRQGSHRHAWTGCIFLPIFASLIFSVLLMLTSLPGNTEAAVKSSGSKRHLLDIVLENYDLDKWPTFPLMDLDNVTAEATRCNISVDIMFISSINVEAMDLTIDMYLNQKWNDKRLRFSESVSKRRLHLKTVEQMRRIWSPDTYIVNAKQANFHHITTENRVVYISGNGDVFYSARITAKVACEMKFHSFPMDNQECMLHLASYAYTTDILQMFWLPEGPVSYKQNVDLNQFHLTNVTTKECVDMYPDGGFPCLKIFFKFERRVAHHLIQTFLPTVLIVTISWVSFYIQADAVPARISLGITTLLTMITLNSGTKQGLPPVSYVKAIDVWMGVCTFFVFSAIWEYVIVEYGGVRDEFVLICSYSLQVCILARRPLGSLGCQRHHQHNQRRYSSSLTENAATRQSTTASSLTPEMSRSESRFIRNSLSSLVIPNLHASDYYHTEKLPQSVQPTYSSFASASGEKPARLPGSFHQFQLVTPRNINQSPPVLDNMHLELQEKQAKRRAASTPNSQQHVVNVNNLNYTTLSPPDAAKQLRVVWEPRISQVETVLRDEYGHEMEEFHLQTTPPVEQIVVGRKKRKVKVKCTCTSPPRSAQERSKRVDILARFMYPLMFLGFNLFYWPYYLNWSHQTSLESLD